MYFVCPYLNIKIQCAISILVSVFSKLDQALFNCKLSAASWLAWRKSGVLSLLLHRLAQTFSSQLHVTFTQIIKHYGS